MEKAVIVLSGAGSGIGRATAQVLGEQARLVLVGRNRAKLEETRGRLREPARHAVVATDTRDHLGLRAALGELGLERDGISAVVANAGVGGENHYGDQDRWSEILETNLTGTYKLIQESLPYMRRGPTGAVANE
jgi:NADP-dependent 3-hydroxy acid dehydrogenase YdfG